VEIIYKMTVILTYINEVPIKRNAVESMPANSKLKERARALRKAGNYAEAVFWQQVHKGKFYKIDFDRQRIIGNYIVDFYVKTLGLVVEIDGESHNYKEDYDEIREEYLLNLGLKIFKITNFRVLNDIENVLKELEIFIIENYS
jgi:very-short-patch-repair endonuclease